MLRFLSVVTFAFASLAVMVDHVEAQGPGAYSFLPFGFYQPYGASYSTSIRTPPYFSTNPPVYYGSRHARPYGLSPFASPPLVQAASNYESRLRSQFEQPQIPTPGPQLNPPLLCDPCLSRSNSPNAAAPVGRIRTNPFVDPDAMVARQ